MHAPNRAKFFHFGESLDFFGGIIGIYMFVCLEQIVLILRSLQSFRTFFL